MQFDIKNDDNKTVQYNYMNTAKADKESLIRVGCIF